MMLPYQMYQALSEERSRELVAAAKRHELVAAARHDSRDATESSSRLKGLTARIAGVLNGSRGARSTVTSARGGGSTMTSASCAGPIGCSA